MLTLGYNETVFMLMLTGRVGCLWLQSIKNLLYVKSCMCDSLCFSVYASQCNMASRKRKTFGFKTEEELADAVNEIVNDSDSDTVNIPEFLSSEESESESVNENDNESNISIPDPSRRQIDVTPSTGFSENDRQPSIPFRGNPGVQFAVENQADVMSYFDHYIPPELTEIVVDQTNLYAQQQIASPHYKTCT